MNGQNELPTAAMRIILYAGDARNVINETLEEAKRFSLREAASHLQKTEEAITLAHRSQTDIIRKEVDGYGYEPSLLFAHAQDTLMTIKSELHLGRQLIDVLKIIKNNK